MHEVDRGVPVRGSSHPVSIVPMAVRLVSTVSISIALMSIALMSIGCGSELPPDGSKRGAGSVASETDRIMAAPRPAWCAEPPRPAYEAFTPVEIESAWFRVYEVQPQVFAIYEPFQFEEVISYLIVGDREALMFDTGLGIGPIREVVDQLASLPVSAINSHSHLDHIGGNASFERVLALDTDYGRANAGGLSNRDVREVLSPEALCADLPEGIDIDNYRIRPYEISDFVSDGTRIDLGGRSLQVISTPGHTPDSLMLLDPDRGLLFTGDTFYEGPIYLFSPETDWRSYRTSVDKVAALIPEMTALLPAHNQPIADPGLWAQLQAALGAIESGEAEGDRTESHVEYEFGTFSILTSASPPRSSP